MKRVAVVALTLALTLGGCSTGVKDEEGWNKALNRGYPCSELIDIAEDLPAKMDAEKVAQDLRNAGCEPPAALGAQG